MQLSVIIFNMLALNISNRLGDKCINVPYRRVCSGKKTNSYTIRHNTKRNLRTLSEAKTHAVQDNGTWICKYVLRTNYFSKETVNNNSIQSFIGMNTKCEKDAFLFKKYGRFTLTIYNLAFICIYTIIFKEFSPEIYIIAATIQWFGLCYLLSNNKMSVILSLFLFKKLGCL